MLPIVALVGRPNVGKSTLFNTLTARATPSWPTCPVSRATASTASADSDTCRTSSSTPAAWSRAPVPPSNADAHADRARHRGSRPAGAGRRRPRGPHRRRPCQSPRCCAAPASRCCSRSTRPKAWIAGVVGADFHRLGLGEPMAIAATHGAGCEALMERRARGTRAPGRAKTVRRIDSIRIAVIGRPNVGKSTLVNRLIGEERVIASDTPGTTRDSILVPFERDGRDFTLIDTAGVRRRARVDDEIERASVARDAAGHRRSAHRGPRARRARRASASRTPACWASRCSAAARCCSP